jgi:predicted RNA-binding protein (virulence factor B family)
MLKQGEYNKLRVCRIENAGYYLTNDYDNEAILFKRELKSNPELGDEFDVFVYSDAENPFIATLKKPKAIINEFAVMKAMSITERGAFLDWGIDKDLFVPYAEQKSKMIQHKNYLVRVFKDEFTDRILASSKIYKFLSNENLNLNIKDEVELLIWENSQLGVKVIVNNEHEGLIFKSDLIAEIHPGEKIIGYVKNIRPDNKIDITLRKPGHHEVNQSEIFILNYLEKNGGFIDLNDDSDPQEIRDKLHMSKKTFKQAIGALYKQRLIKLEPDGIYLLKSEP